MNEDCNSPYKKPYKKFKPRTSFVKKEIIYDEKKLYNYGINRLSVRDYARKELFTRMVRFQEDITIIDKVLDKLELQGYLSDERRIKAMLSQYNNRESINKTKTRILQKGVTKDQLQDVLYQLEEYKIIDEDAEYSEEIQKVIDLLIKKYKTYNKDNWDKMIRFLASKGFKYDDISKGVKAFSLIL